MDANPYGDDIIIKQKESVDYARKRMSVRLQDIKKKILTDSKGQGKLIDKIIKDLTVYYDLAIRNNPNSIEDMKRAIWATFYHRASSDELTTFVLSFWGCKLVNLA